MKFLVKFLLYLKILLVKYKDVKDSLYTLLFYRIANERISCKGFLNIKYLPVVTA